MEAQRAPKHTLAYINSAKHADRSLHMTVRPCGPRHGNELDVKCKCTQSHFRQVCVTKRRAISSWNRSCWSETTACVLMQDCAERLPVLEDMRWEQIELQSQPGVRHEEAPAEGRQATPALSHVPG